jgi:hypothetical protein
MVLPPLRFKNYVMFAQWRNYHPDEEALPDGGSKVQEFKGSIIQGQYRRSSHSKSLPGVLSKGSTASLRSTPSAVQCSRGRTWGQIF